MSTTQQQFQEQLNQAEALARQQFQKELTAKEALAIQDFLKQRAGPEARQQFQEQLDAQMLEERKRFEAELAAKRAKQKRQFAQDMSLAEIESRKTFTSQLGESARASTKEFEANWSKFATRERTGFQERLASAKVAFKRDYMLTYGKHPTPRAMQDWKRQQTRTFETQLKSEKQAQTKTFQSNLDVWGKEQWATFFYGLEPWYKEERKKFEASQQDWVAKEQERLALLLPKWEKKEWNRWRVWAESGSEIVKDLKAFEAGELKPWKAEALEQFKLDIAEWRAHTRKKHLLTEWQEQVKAFKTPLAQTILPTPSKKLPEFPGTLEQFKRLSLEERKYYSAPPREVTPTPSRLGRDWKYPTPPVLTGREIIELAVEKGGISAAMAFGVAGVEAKKEYAVFPHEIKQAIQFVPIEPERKRVSMLKDIMKQAPFEMPSPATILFESVPALQEYRESVQEKGAVMTLMGGIEQVWGKPRYPYLGLLPSAEEKRLAIKGTAEFLLGPIGTVESLIRPQVPTVSGAVLEPLLFGKTTQAEFLAKHPTYAMGEAIGEYLFGRYVVAPVVEKAWAITPKAIKAPVGKVGAKLLEKMPKRLKGLFVEEKQVSYWVKEPVEEPSWMRAMSLEKLAHKQWLGKYKPTYQLIVEGRARAFVESTKIPSGLVHTPYATTLEKVIGGPSTTVVTSGTQKLLLKTGTTEITKQLPKLTLQKTYPAIAKQVAKQVPKIAYTQVAKTILKPTALSKLITKVIPIAIPSLVRYAGPKVPSKFAVKNVWGEVAELKPYPQEVEIILKLKPYPQREEAKLKIKSVSEVVSEPFVKLTPEVTRKAKIEHIQLPKTIPSIMPISATILGTKQEVGLLQKELQVQVQELVQVQKEVSVAKLIQAEGFITPKSPLIAPPRKRKKWVKRKVKKVKKPLFGQYELLYPVATESEAARFILGKSHGKVSVANAIYGKPKRKR